MSKLHRNQLNRRLWEQARRDERMWPFKPRHQNLAELKERRAIFKASEKKPIQFWDVDSITLDELRKKFSDRLLADRKYIIDVASPSPDVVDLINKGFMDGREARLEILRNSFKEPKVRHLSDLDPGHWYEFYIRGALSQVAYVTRDHDVQVQNGNYTTFDFLYALRNGVVKKLTVAETYEKGVIEI